MRALILTLPAATLLAALFAGLLGWRQITAWVGIAANGYVAVIAAVIAGNVVEHGARSATGVFRVDALSALMATLVGCIGLLGSGYGVSYFNAQLAVGRTTPSAVHAYAVLMHLFSTAMLVAVLADNLGIIWVAIEGITITTAFLVGHNRSRASLEASWKYMVISSVGVAIAFLGTVVVWFASRHLGSDHTALDWSTLVKLAPRLDPHVLRLGIGLLILGYGTKAGLAPMHTWLPDTYAQAPAPVTAVLAGAGSAVAFYAILRVKVIADITLGTGYTRGLLVVAGLSSLAIAASLLIAQRDYKRMLAYSSIEHMGLMAIGAAIGTPLAMTAALLHLIGHGLVKSAVFCAAGELDVQGSGTELADVRGLLSSRPAVGACIGLCIAALLGLPPFSLFVSELGIARAGFAAGLGWVVAVALGLLFVAFAAVASHARIMLLGPPTPQPVASRRSSRSLAPVAAGLASCAVLGITIWPIDRLLHAAAAVLT